MDNTTACTKHCSKCGTDKPLEDFARKSAARDGRQPRCKTCQSEIASGWYQANRSAIRAKVNADRAADRERQREYNNALRKANPERYAANQKRYRDANRSAIAKKNRSLREERLSEYREKSRRYYEANKDAAFDRARRRRALKLAAYHEPYTRAEVWDKSNGHCGLCGSKIQTSTWHVDHILPLSRGGDDTLQNTQAAHPKCNWSKGNRVLSD